MQMERRFRRRLLRVLALLMILTSLGAANAQTRTSNFVQKRSLSSTTSALPEGLASSVSSVTEASTDEQRLEYVVYLAQNALGKPCRADANPPESFGCNDLALYCYGLAGFDVADALENTAAWLPYSDLQRGDLLCFDVNSADDNPCDCTGIYLGDGYFIHASSGAGRVILSNLERDSFSYYRKAFSWGVRLTND